MLNKSWTIFIIERILAKCTNILYWWGRICILWHANWRTNALSIWDIIARKTWSAVDCWYIVQHLKWGFVPCWWLWPGCADNHLHHHVRQTISPSASFGDNEHQFMQSRFVLFSPSTRSLVYYEHSKKTDIWQSSNQYWTVSQVYHNQSQLLGYCLASVG